MPRFQYQARSNDQWAKRESGKNFEGFIKDDYVTFTPKKENWIRILPPTWANPSHYGLDIWVHYGVGPNNASVLCSRRMQGKPCPICEAHDRAEQAGREDADQLRPTPRVLIWLIDRKDDKESRPKAWAQPKTKVDLEICQICRDRMTGELYQIDNPDAGYDLTFVKEGEGLQTNYSGFALARRESAVEDRYLEYIVQHPLPDILNWRNYDEVAALFEGQASITHPAAPQATVPTPTPVTTVPSQAAPVTYQPPAAPAPAPVIVTPAPAFTSEWVNSNCPACGQRQFTVPTGVSCQNGHLQERLPFPPTPPPQPVAAAPTPAPVATFPAPSVASPAPPMTAAASAAPVHPASPTPAPVGDTANTLRARFRTGNR